MVVFGWGKRIRYQVDYQVFGINSRADAAIFTKMENTGEANLEVQEENNFAGCNN